VRHFAGRPGDRVTALARTAPAALPADVRFLPYDMPAAPSPTELAGIDVVVHCAFVRHAPGEPDSDRTNREGTLALAAAARAAGARFVFFSTMSAHEAAESHYGRHKFELESLLDPSRDTIVRPGLVIGEGGGLFDTIRTFVSTSRVVPLIGGGTQRVQTLAVDDLCAMIGLIVDRGLTGRILLSERHAVTMRELYEGIARISGAAPRYVSIPMGPMDLALRAAGALRLPLPVTRENLLGLKQLRAFDVGPDLARLGYEPADFAATMARLARAESGSPRATTGAGGAGGGGGRPNRVRRLARAMAPTSDEIRRLARRETDPAEADRFQPITKGPVVALLLLGAVGLAALVVAPFRLFAARRRNAEATTTGADSAGRSGGRPGAAAGDAP
jgi:nucleoside-diphosphate-sugar epimerase